MKRYIHAEEQREELSFDEVAGKCAEYFIECMKDAEVDTFKELKDLYWWESSDIKDEIESVLKDYDWWIDGNDVYYGDEIRETFSYRALTSKMYKLIREYERSIEV